METIHRGLFFRDFFPFYSSDCFIDEVLDVEEGLLITFFGDFIRVYLMASPLNSEFLREIYQ